MRKPIVYGQIPAEFDQQTQAVYQTEPVEMKDHIYVGVQVVDLPEVEEGEEEFEM